MKKYPLGIQSFEKLIQGNNIYIDKTDLVYKLTQDNNYVFLSRPRRFGKSLLVSTLKSYFEGRKELFSGLAIENLEKEWIEYPVIHISLGSAKVFSPEALEDVLNYQLSKYEKGLGIKNNNLGDNIRLQAIIETAYEKTGQKAVVLIDEYDAPLLSVIEDFSLINKYREIMHTFYSPLKDCDEYLRFVFITGVTKFSQLSLFSELNNLKNISMLSEYATICGITKDEMLESFKEGISDLAESKGITYNDAVELLQKNYDGYHFTYPSPDIYNPFSLLNALSDKQIDNYWFSSGGTRLAIYALQKNSISPKKLLSNFEVLKDEVDKPFERTDDVIPLLYQSGYLTIKGYDELLKQYTLSIPNKEVEMGLFKNLLPYYLEQKPGDRFIISEIAKGLLYNDLDLLFKSIKIAFASVPQCNNTDYEGHYQSMLCLLFTLLGQYVDAEVHTPNGRVDVVINNGKKIYLFEIKLNKSAETALEQIEKNDYAQKFILLGLPIVKIGVNFNSETRNIDDWVVIEG